MKIPDKQITISDLANIPNYSNKELPNNLEQIEEFFVSKHKGGDEGPAISPESLATKINEMEITKDENLKWFITNEGQFQLYIGIFKPIK